MCESPGQRETGLIIAAGLLASVSMCVTMQSAQTACLHHPHHHPSPGSTDLRDDGEEAAAGFPSFMWKRDLQSLLDPLNDFNVLHVLLTSFRTSDGGSHYIHC